MTRLTKEREALARQDEYDEFSSELLEEIDYLRADLSQAQAENERLKVMIGATIVGQMRKAEDPR